MNPFERTPAAAHPDQPDNHEPTQVLANGELPQARCRSGEAGQHRIDDFAFLSQREIEHYLFVVESCVQVRSGHQFFLWAQGQLQTLLPHEVLFCAHGNLDRAEFAAVNYSRTPLPEAHFAAICDPRQGLLTRMIGAWRKNGEEPRLAGGGNGSTAVDPCIETLAGRFDLGNLACHGTQSINGGTNSCFIFARMPQPPGRRQSYLLELLVPHLHAAFVRTLIDGRRRKNPPAPPGGHHRHNALPPAPPHGLTGRELEILRWVSEGKSNLQIGHTLHISPLTVKNHVQNILRKLEVRNRTQAVARAINLRLLGAHCQP